jgi:hypothetical protein
VCGRGSPSPDCCWPRTRRWSVQQAAARQPWRRRFLCDRDAGSLPRPERPAARPKHLRQPRVEPHKAELVHDGDVFGRSYELHGQAGADELEAHRMLPPGTTAWEFDKPAERSRSVLRLGPAELTNRFPDFAARGNQARVRGCPIPGQPQDAGHFPVAMTWPARSHCTVLSVSAAAAGGRSAVPGRAQFRCACERSSIAGGGGPCRAGSAARPRRRPVPSRCPRGLARNCRHGPASRRAPFGADCRHTP